MNLESKIYNIENIIQDMTVKYTMKKNIKKRLEKKLKQKTKEMNETKKTIETLEQVRILLQRTSEYAREQIKQQIELLVTHCLQFVFGPNIEFSIELVEARSRTEAHFYVISTYDDYKVKTKPQDARGGGIVDVISLALRIAVIQSTNLYKDGPLILDEPAKHVSDEYIVNVAQFLKQISEVFQTQIIMVTHNNYLSEIADLAYNVELKDGCSIMAVYEP